MQKNTDLHQMEELFEMVSNYFTLLSEPMRLKILYSLCEGERSVNDIVAGIGATQANVSRHLNMLYRAKILLRRREATQIFYRIEDQNALNICQHVCAEMFTRIEKQDALKKKALKNFSLQPD